MGVTRLETSRPSPQVEFPGTDSEVEICGQEVSGKGLRHLLKSERSRSRQRERLNCEVAYASESSEAGVAKTMRTPYGCMSHPSVDAGCHENGLHLDNSIQQDF